MFDAISPTYDFLNRLLSFGQDGLWRRAAVKALKIRPDGIYLDLCTGTGDVALLAKKMFGARVAGLDFSSGMLGLARKKAARSGCQLLLARGDALAVPFKGCSLDGVVVAFGLRNFEDWDRGLSEMARTLKPGGRAVILEFAEPHGRPFGLVYRVYFRRVLPFIGRIVSGRPRAYAYLPATVTRFPNPDEIKQRMALTGLSVVLTRLIAGGAVVLYAAERPKAQGPEWSPEPAKTVRIDPWDE